MEKWNILAEDKIIVDGVEKDIYRIYINTKKCENSVNSSVQYLGMIATLETDPSDGYRQKAEWYEVFKINGKKYGYRVPVHAGGRPRIHRDWENQSDYTLNAWREAVYTETGLNPEALDKSGLTIVTNGGYCWEHNKFFWRPVYKIVPVDDVEHCEDCDAPLAWDDVVRIEPYITDRHICSSCYDHYRECQNCGEMFRPGEYDSFCCEGCAEEYERNHRTSEDIIHRYSYTPDNWNYHRSTDEDISNCRYFGIELEVKQSDSSEDVEWLNQDEEEWFYFQKYDSSIPSGTEVVFHPQTREYFDNSGYNLITELYNNFGYLSCGSNSRVGSGMHVHISRAAFAGDDAIKKFCELINIKYEKSLTEFSERTADELEEWTMFHPEEPMRGERDRYAAVNLKNADTVEVRIFRTPARPQKVAEVIHLLDTLVDVANGTKTTCSWLDLQESRIARK